MATSIAAAWGLPAGSSPSSPPRPGVSAPPITPPRRNPNTFTATPAQPHGIRPWRPSWRGTDAWCMRRPFSRRSPPTSPRNNSARSARPKAPVRTRGGKRAHPHQAAARQPARSPEPAARTRFGVAGPSRMRVLHGRFWMPGSDSLGLVAKLDLEASVFSPARSAAAGPRALRPSSSGPCLSRLIVRE